MGDMRKKLVAILLATVVACSLVPALAFASGSKTLTAQSFSTTTSTLNKKAATVKTGSYKLILKKGEGYVKFKATKNKTYSFTFSNLQGKHTYYGFVTAQLPNSRQPKYCFAINASTQGGKTNTLWLAKSGYESKSGKKVNRSLVSRTAKIKLKKGQTIYFHIYTSGQNQRTLNLKIK